MVAQLSASALAPRITDVSARGIADQLAYLIRTGQISRGTRLPPVRALAAALHVGPTTVATAWSRLKALHLVYSESRSGTFVLDQCALTGRRRAALEAAVSVLDLSNAHPDPELLPDLTEPFAEALSRVDSGSYPDDFTEPLLLKELRSSWPFEAAGFTATLGGHDAISRIADTVLQPHDRVVVEQVGAPSLLDIIDAHASLPVFVPCDDEGPIPEHLAEAMKTRPAMVLLQPRMASPNGHALTRQRMGALAEVLAEHDCLVVEDDAMPELARTPAVSLGEVLPERTVLVRSWNKSHGPQLRVGAMGGAGHVVARVRAAQQLTGSWPSAVSQRALALMLTDDATQRLTRRARGIYADRRKDLVTALGRVGLHTTGVAGLSVWVEADEGPRAVSLLGQRGIGIAPGRLFAPHEHGRGHVRVATTLAHHRHDEIAEVLAVGG
ncbi:PLP-dependent aminotransferase family protein [Nocardioides sp. LHG3406-4]|uniref:aminotransferase-like domain-containing protein n=1 Tax=Nocardioides sp. LHG3406-4 TaxID=2804575 RepID=UPI003CEE9204